MEERLKEEKYFEAIPDLSLEELIQEAVDGKWEREIKPGYPRDESGEDSDQPYDWLKIPGLRDNREKGFRDRAMPIMKYTYMISPMHSDANGKQGSYRGCVCTDTGGLLGACSFPNYARRQTRVSANGQYIPGAGFARHLSHHVTSFLKFSVQRILLVGGFGGSERLRQHLQAQCDAYTSAHRRRPIIVLVPDTP